jgi:hypothetical protein
MSRDRLLLFLLAYAGASLVHHVHNAELLDQYPNMPAWFSPAAVYAAWLGTTALGLIGYWALRRGYRFTGPGLLVLYGCYGLDSLVHYALAPLPAHTLAMNLSIWLEAATAAALLVMVFRKRTCGAS